MLNTFLFILVYIRDVVDLQDFNAGINKNYINFFYQIN